MEYRHDTDTQDMFSQKRGEAIDSTPMLSLPEKEKMHGTHKPVSLSVWRVFDGAVGVCAADPK
ncbi:hypothetical protein KTH_54440 [Thermosporothrix hazakensis]|nr:hypothetical protein KTH_54440 [Thermosporothrix hazakensis]